MQIMVKNAFFCITRTKQDDPNGEFFLILLGTNHLEGIFGLIRSQNGSDVNVSMYSLSSQMLGAVECHSILLQQPELDCGPCRLWLQGLSVVMGIDQKVDHLNPALWKGDVWVSGVQIMSAWKSGQYQVESYRKIEYARADPC